MNIKDLLTGNITAKAHRKIMVLLLATLPGFIPFAASTFADDLQTAENILLYQRETGGWPKNYDRQQELTEAQRQDVLNNKSKNDSMIDNGATHTEICLLADAFQKTQDDRFKQAALRGIRYLLDGQYDNGGWPQQFPGPRGYARYITFNDNAMIGVINQPIFCSRDGVPKRTLAEISYERRNGYSWLGYYAQGLLQNDLPRWQRRLEPE